MFNSRIIKLRALQTVQIILSIACFITYLQLLNPLGLVFAFLSGWVFGDFLITLKQNKNQENE